jgi:aspartate-semialdehyde dehydrogenase
MGYRVAVVGATENVGREILTILDERKFAIDDIFAVASERSVSKEVSFGEERVLKTVNLQDFNFKKVDIVFFSTAARLSRLFAQQAAKAGAVVIDNSSAFSMDPVVPLVVPEVNAQALEGYRKSNIIASPNCITIPLTVALNPLQELSPIKRIVASTYQSVLGAGREAMDELFNQTKRIYMNAPIQKKHFTKQIAFNVIPHIDDFNDDGFTVEEMKITQESQKILNSSIGIVVTSVRVPVFMGNGIAATVEFKNPIEENQARALLREADGVSVVDSRADERYVTPVECIGEDNVFISRLRRDPTVPNGLVMWIVADNLRKGAALNAVQIAESLVSNYM